jgi:hypothetical protein
MNQDPVVFKINVTRFQCAYFAFPHTGKQKRFKHPFVLAHAFPAGFPKTCYLGLIEKAYIALLALFFCWQSYVCARVSRDYTILYSIF